MNIFCGELNTLFLISGTEVVLFGGRIPLGDILNLKPSCAVMQCTLYFFFSWAIPGNKIPAFSDLSSVFCIDCKFFDHKTSKQGGSSAMES